MKTFVKVLTTDSAKSDFNIRTYESFTYRDKIIHLVRQCVGIKYLKLLYGDDLWFLYKLYEKDLAAELNNLIDQSKKIHTFKKDEELNSLLSKAIYICNDALSDNVISFPISISIEDFTKFYVPNDIVPEFGSINFVNTLYTHIKNCTGNSSSFEGKASLLIPYNAMNQISSWTEITGQSYEYDIKEIQVHCEKIGIAMDQLSPMLTLLVSVKNSIYHVSINSILAMLSSLMIEPSYLNDYNGYLSALNKDTNYFNNKKSTEPNAIIYKGAYRILFDEIENSVFSSINNQCRSVITMDKRVGYTAPITNIITAKNMFWLLSYINQNFVDFLNDNKLLTKFIAYFEPKITPDKITELLNVFYKLPNVSVRDDVLLNNSGISSLFNRLKSPFSLEADEEKEDTEDTDPETPEDDKKDEPKEDTDKTDDTATPDDDTAGDDTSPEEQAEIDGDAGEQINPSPDEEVVSDEQALPEYLLKLGSPPDLNNVIYRTELDRTITCIIKNPPKTMDSDTLKMLRNIQAYWLYLLALPTLKLLINKINEGISYEN